MLFKSEIVTQASGSIGGTTYAHNSSGLYRRARSIPVNPNSAAQQAVRSNFTSLALAWNNVLTEAQRTGWDNYAELTPITNVLGDPLTLSGQQEYIRCNAVRLAAGGTRVDVPPAIPGLAMLTPPVATISIAAGTISVAFTDTDDWAIAVGGHLKVQTSRFISPGRNFFKGPYRNLLAVDGAVVPPTTPVTNAANAFGQSVALATAGQKCSLRYVATNTDGRISSVVSELVAVVA